MREYEQDLLYADVMTPTGQRHISLCNVLGWTRCYLEGETRYAYFNIVSWYPGEVTFGAKFWNVTFGAKLLPVKFPIMNLGQAFFDLGMFFFGIFWTFFKRQRWCGVGIQNFFLRIWRWRYIFSESLPEEISSCKYVLKFFPKFHRKSDKPFESYGETEP